MYRYLANRRVLVWYLVIVGAKGIVLLLHALKHHEQKHQL